MGTIVLLKKINLLSRHQSRLKHYIKQFIKENMPQYFF